MTVHKKCDGCRARKIKCDEKQPSCGPCTKRELLCVYRFCERTSIFVHEQLRSTEAGGVKVDTEVFQVHETHAEDASREEDKQLALSGSLSLRKRSVVGRGSGQILTFAIRPARTKRPKMKEKKSQSKSPSSKCSGTNGERELSTTELLTTSFSVMTRLWPSGSGLELRWNRNFYDSPCGHSGDANVYDIWTKRIPVLIGHAEFLDLAICYFVDCMQLFLNCNETNERRACTTGQKALKSLRRAVEAEEDTTQIGQILLAITLHRYAESFKALNTNNHLPHMRAIDRILRNLPVRMLEDDIVASIRDNLFEDEVLETLLRGTNSAFDNLGRPNVPVTTNHLVNDGLLALQELYIRLPRLARLVRSACKGNGNGSPAAEPYELAKQLLTSTNNDFIEQILERETVLRDESIYSMPHMDNVRQIDFISVAAFVLAAKYYTYRALLCGLLLNLCTLQPNTSHFSAQQIQNEDLSAALAIAQCAEYALRPPNAHPLIALRLCLPVRMAFGAWHRLQRRESQRELFATREYEMAVAMKSWCVDTLKGLDHIWGNVTADFQQLERMNKVFAGGPLVDLN